MIYDVGLDRSLILLHGKFEYCYLIRQPLYRIQSLLLSLIEQEEKDKAYDIWLIKYQHMTKENYISFNDFWESIINPPIINHQTKEEIISDVQDILNQFRGVLPEVDN